MNIDEIIEAKVAAAVAKQMELYRQANPLRDDRIYTVGDVAKYLKLSDQSVYRLIRERKLEASQTTSKSLRITHQAIQNYLKRTDL